MQSASTASDLHSVVSNMATLTLAKAALRKQIKDILKDISTEEKAEQSANVLKKVNKN